MKEFVDDNQAFIKEILALEAEVPEGTEFQTDINENVRSVVYTSLGLLCDNKSFGEEATNIYDAVPEESIVDYNNNDDGEGTISVEESGFENMRQFLGCKETIGSLSATSSEEFLCQDGEVRAEGLSPSSDMQSSIKDIVYIPLSNGDERAIFTEQIIQDEIDGIGTAVITKADNELGVQLKSYNIVADSDKIDQLLGSIAVLGKQLGSDGKLFSGDMTDMSDESKIHALIDSVRGYCYTEPNDEDIYANRAESLVYKPVFSEDDIKSNTEKSIIVKEDAFDDYLALVDYDGTIDDIVANKALQNKYNCSIKRNGTNIEFTFSGEFEMTYWWVETDMIDQINKDGFKILKNGKIEVNTIEQTIKNIQYRYSASINALYMTSAILFVFGSISLTNMLMVDFQNRKREFGLLEAVGTTRQQLKAMLDREMGIYLGGSLVIALVFGSILSVIVCRRLDAVNHCITLVLPWLFLLALVVVLAVIYLIFTAYAKSELKKTSILSAIREE